MLLPAFPDGRGPSCAPVRRGGQGYLNMSDRLGAIGGTVRWESSPGAGAKVSGSVPLGRN